MLKSNASSSSVSPGVVALDSPEFLERWLCNNLRYLGVGDMVKAVFCLSKSLNKRSPFVMEKNYPVVRKVKAQKLPYVFSQFLPSNLVATWKESGKTRPLLVGEAYTNAAVSGTCMLCLKECPGKKKSSGAIVALMHGIPSCPSCWVGKEVRLDLCGISLGMIPLLDVSCICRVKGVGLRRPIKGGDRESKGPPVCGSDKEKTTSRSYFHAVEKEFVFGKNEAVVYPRENTLEYYRENNKDEIESARQISEALSQPVKDVDEWSNARRMVDLKRQIERASGHSV